MMESLDTRIIIRQGDVPVDVVFELVLIDGAVWMVCVNTRIKMRLNLPEGTPSGDEALRALQTAMWMIARYIEHEWRRSEVGEIATFGLN